MNPAYCKQYVESEDIIKQVGEFPCLYDITCEAYKDKDCKNEAWKIICKNLVEGYEDLDDSEKFEVEKELRKRWKSLRDAYTRTLKQQPEYTKTGLLKKKHYVYAKQMSFLLPTFYAKHSGSLEEPTSESEETIRVVGMDVETDGPLDFNEEEFSHHGAVNGIQVNPVKRKTREDFDENTINMHSVPANSKEEEENSDRMFLLSLIPHFKRLKQSKKIDIQIQFLQILREHTSGQQ